MGRMWKIAALAFTCAFTDIAAQYEFPAWSPDGKSIVFVMKTDSSDWNIYTANLDGTNLKGSGVRQLTRGGAWDAAWFPDGQNIAFVSTVDGKRQISAMSADGSNVRQLTSGPAEHFHPAFSHSGARIAVTTTENGASRIAVMDATGSNAAPLTPLDQRSRWPAWSPDGKHIAYFVQGPVSEIWQVDVETLDRSKLFDSGLSATTLDWSPDGNEIALTRMIAKETGIDILNLKTRQIRRVLGAELGLGQPRWSPDGSQLMFSTNTGVSILDLKPSRLRVVLQ